MSLILKELQREAITYLIGTTAECGHTLSQTIAQVVSSSKGKCFTIVPATTPEHYLYKFRTGGLYWEDRKGRTIMPVRNDTTPVVANIIDAFFAMSETHCAVAEDALFKADDLEVQAASEYYTYLVFGEELYFFNRHQNSINQVISTLKESNASYYSFFALLSIEASYQERLRHPRCSISKQDVDLLSNAVQGIIQSAYDGESYLIWDRDGTLLAIAESALNKAMTLS